MPNTAPFDEHTERYDAWFEEYEEAYRSELAALERLFPTAGYGLEIGVGGARFAAPLGIDVGIDPSGEMLAQASSRGIETLRGVAEFLPFEDGTFDVALLVTTICFVDDVEQTLAEAARVLDPDGALVMGYIDENTPVGEIYQERKATNPFYRDATFVSTEELVEALKETGFTSFDFAQTVFEWPGNIDDTEPVKPGYGEGSFVVINATRA